MELSASEASSWTGPLQDQTLPAVPYHEAWGE